jgi:hypothetical protein
VLTLDTFKWPDGASGAPAGRPQYPWLLGGYGPYRPPWNVAGVDYRTGIPEDKLARLRDWRTLSGPNLNVDLVNGVITFNADYVFDSYDFSLGTGAILRNAAQPFGASNITFLNCNFALPAGNPQTASGGGFWSFADQGPANIIIRNCNFDGTNMLNMGAFIDARGSIDLQYNWFRNSGQQILSMDSQNTTVTCTYKYNFVDNFHQLPGAHRNCLQWIPTGTISATAIFMFNTTYQFSKPADPTTGPGEMLQFNAGIVGTSTIVFPNHQVKNNTFIARPVPNNSINLTFSVSTLVHGANNATDVTGGQNNNNYFDTTGTGLIYYPGTMTPASGWSSSGNIDMNTGAIINPT